MAAINFFHGDCMEFMNDKPDGFYDLAVVDPPYGGGGIPSATEVESIDLETKADDLTSMELPTPHTYNRFGGWFKKYNLTSPKKWKQTTSAAGDERDTTFYPPHEGSKNRRDMGNQIPIPARGCL